MLLLLLSVSMLGAVACRASDRHDLQLERLRAEQRLEQQRLEIDQWQRERALDRSGSVLSDEAVRRRLQLQLDAVRQERQLQALRFQLDQQRLMQSTTRQPLQPAPTPGALRAW